MTDLSDVRSLRTNPARIRVVLADVASSNVHAAARRHGIHPKTVYRWQRRRETDAAWPTDADITLWEQLRDERGASRQRRAAQKRDYMKRVYLARGLMQVPSLGTTRRLRALYALGWTGNQLGERLGISSARVSHLVSGVRPKVHRDTAARVAALYDDLSMTVPQDPEVLPRRHIRVHDRQRRQSAAKGWRPPLFWDDIDRDPEPPAVDETDCAIEGCSNLRQRREWCELHYKRLYRAGQLPAAQAPVIDPVVVERVLAGVPVPAATLAERVEIVARWRATGRPLADLERITGWKVERYYRPNHRKVS